MWLWAAVLVGALEKVVVSVSIWLRELPLVWALESVEGVVSDWAGAWLSGLVMGWGTEWGAASS